MCLTIKSDYGKHDVAESDIIVYKLVESFKNEPNKKGYYTPFRGFEVTIGESYSSELDVIDNKVGVGLHSFGDLNSCIQLARLYAEPSNPQHIVKCVIPVGSKYYKGCFDYFNNCYASDHIKYIEVVGTLK